MIIYITNKYIRIPAAKLNLTLEKIRGKTYKEILTILKYSHKKVNIIIWKTLYSLISTAKYIYGYKKKDIIILQAFSNQGPILKRIRARAKGQAFRINKKVAHITISIK